MKDLPKLKRNAIVEVIWKDSNYSSGWHDKKALDKFKEETLGRFSNICDVGYFLEYAKGFILLCQGHVYDPEDTVQSLSYLNAIPVECIAKINVLRRGGE